MMSLDHQILVCFDNDNEDIGVEKTDEALEIKCVGTTTGNNKPKLSPSLRPKRKRQKSLQYLMCQPCGLAFSTHDGYRLHLQKCGNQDEISVAKCLQPDCTMIFGGESELAIHLLHDHHVHLDISESDIEAPNTESLGKNSIVTSQADSLETCLIETSIVDSLGVEESMEISMSELQSSNFETSSNTNLRTALRINNYRPIYQCPRCSLTFTHKMTLFRHRKRCLVPELFECKKCNLSLTKHVYEKHQTKKSCITKKVYINCSQPNCTKSFVRHRHFWDHLRYDHGIYIKVEKRYFKNMEAFYEWKDKEDREKFVKTVSKIKNVRNGSGFSYQIYQCIFSFFGRNKAENYKIPHTYCPARLLVKETKEGVFLTYYPFHNHKLDATNTRYFYRHKNTYIAPSKEESSQFSSGAQSSNQILDKNVPSCNEEDAIEMQDCVYIIVDSLSDISCSENSLEITANQLENSQAESSSPISINDISLLNVPLKNNLIASSPKVTSSSISSKNISQAKNIGGNKVKSNMSCILLQEKPTISPSTSIVTTNSSILKNNQLRKSVPKTNLQASANKTLLKNTSNNSFARNSLLGNRKVVSLKSGNIEDGVDVSTNDKTQYANLIENSMKDHDYVLENPNIAQKKLSKVRQQLELKLIELMRLIVLEEIRPLVPRFHSIISDLCKQAEGCLQDYENKINLEQHVTSKTMLSDSHLICSQKLVNTNGKKKNMNISKPSNVTSLLKNRLSGLLEENLSYKTESAVDNLGTINANVKMNGNAKSIQEQFLNNGKCPFETSGNNAKCPVKRPVNNFNQLAESSSNDDKPLKKNFNIKPILKSSSKNGLHLPEQMPINHENNAKSLTFYDTPDKKSCNLRPSVFGRGLSFTKHLNVENHSNLIMNVGTQQLNVVHLKSIDIYITDREVSKLTDLCQVFKKGWLFDCVITAFLEVLASKFKDVVVVDPAITYLVAHGIDYTQAFPKFKLGMENTLLIPLNLNNGHWALMVTKISSREIIFFDPKKGMDVHGYGHFIKPWMEMFNKTCNNQDDWTLIQPQRMLQSDTHSCGVYVCWYGQQYLYNKSYIEPFQPDVFRNHIYTTITDNANL